MDSGCLFDYGTDAHVLVLFILFVNLCTDALAVKSYASNFSMRFGKHQWKHCCKGCAKS